MAQTSPHADTARHQLEALVVTTAARIGRYAGEMQDDSKHRRPVNIHHARQIAASALVLLEKAAEISRADEDAAKAAAAAKVRRETAA
jgi:hypothetical protein